VVTALRVVPVTDAWSSEDLGARPMTTPATWSGGSMSGVLPLALHRGYY